MGVGSLIDIMGSAIVGGILLLILFRMQDNARENTFNFTGELTVQENVVAIVELLEYDLRKIGYCEDPNNMPIPGYAILYADSSRIKFIYDVDFNGSVDEVEYYLGNADELSATTNPDDKFLYRSINGKPVASNLGVTQFKMKFYNVFGLELTPPLISPTYIASIQLDVKCENTSAFEEEYRYAFWRQIRMSSRNLYNK